MLSPIIIDCDTGRDDALALWLAIKLGCNLSGVITSFGNTTLENVTKNTAGVLSYIDADHIPIFQGASEPFLNHIGYQEVTLPRQALAGNGLCNIDFPINRSNFSPSSSIEQYVDFIYKTAEKQGLIDYIILGPSTNFARLCEYMGDDISSVIKSVNILGGKIGCLWDKNPQADFNIICDPHAVERILQTSLLKRFITLDTTWDISISLVDIEKLEPVSLLGQKTKEIMQIFCQKFAIEPIFRFHDPAVLLLYNTDIFSEENIVINTNQQSSEYGRLSYSTLGYKANICQFNHVNRKLLLENILTKLDLKFGNSRTV